MNNNLSAITIAHAVNILNKEEIIAYPTESVFGIGCDPDSELAVNQLLWIKHRSIEKGFILIASDYVQLRSYIDDTDLTKDQREVVFTSWPGPVTFVFPAKTSTPRWLTGNFNSVAVRVTDHPIIIEFCRAFGKPLITTSANLSGQQPCYTIQELRLQFGEYFPVVEGETGGRKNPSEIRDVLTGEYFRRG